MSWRVAISLALSSLAPSLRTEALVQDRLLFIAGSEELDPVVRVGVARLQGLDLLHACGSVLQREPWVHGALSLRGETRPGGRGAPADMYKSLILLLILVGTRF